MEYFVRRVVTNSLEISFQRAMRTALTTNRGKTMIMWRIVTNIMLFLLSALNSFLSLAMKFLVGHFHFEFSYACFWMIFMAKNLLSHRWSGFGHLGEYFFVFQRINYSKPIRILLRKRAEYLILKELLWTYGGKSCINTLTSYILQ
jgi:hypothetical protein